MTNIRCLLTCVILVSFIMHDQVCGIHQEETLYIPTTSIATDTEFPDQNQDDFQYSTEKEDLSPDLEPNYNCNGSLVCIRKCCTKGSLIDMKQGCMNISLYNATDWEPKLYLVDELNIVIIDRFVSLPNEAKYANYVCGIHEGHEFHLRKDGSVYHYYRQEIFTSDFYCIDHKYEDGKVSVGGALCYDQVVKSEFDKIADKFLMAALCLSTIFLVGLLVVHLLSSVKKDTQTKCTISSCISLLFGFVLAIVNMSPVVNYMPIDKCVALAISVQFFLLSFYFWLNVMCYEISRIIRGTMQLHSYKELTKSERRYFVYCAYAWGMPLIISLVTIVMQYLPEFSEEVERYIIRPSIAEGRCWFKEIGGAVYAYYYGIEIFLHVFNACFMGHTTFLIYKDKFLCLSCKSNRFSATQLRTHNSTNYLAMFKQQLMIYIMYLFIWILNAASLINPNVPFWRIIDVIVASQGLFLFIIVTTPKKYQLLMQAYEKISDIANEFSNRVSTKKIRITGHTNSSFTQNEESPF